MNKLPYLRTMFATCMLFQSIFVLCVLLWLALPELQGNGLLQALFPGFRWLTAGAFLYGLIASMPMVGSAPRSSCSSFNLWPSFASSLFGRVGALRQ